MVRQAVGRRARILLAVASLGWFFYVVYATAFLEGFVFLSGILTVAFWLALFSRMRFRLVRWSLVLLLGFATVFGGNVFIFFSQRIQEAKVAFTESLLRRTGDALMHYRVASGALPNCPWSCMAEELEKYRLWHGDIRYLDRGVETGEYVAHIPQRDRWGCRYAFDIIDDRAFALTSSGPDRRYGTSDDIRFEYGEEQYRSIHPPAPVEEMPAPAEEAAPAAANDAA